MIVEKLKELHNEYIKSYGLIPNLLFIGLEYYRELLLSKDHEINSNSIYSRSLFFYNSLIIPVYSNSYEYGFFKYDHLNKSKDILYGDEILIINLVHPYDFYNDINTIEIPRLVIDTFNINFKYIDNILCHTK